MDLSRHDFYRFYYEFVAPVVRKQLGCNDMEFIYISGEGDVVCIRLRSSLLVFC